MEKKCQNCGVNLPDGALFCPECGTKYTPSEPEAAEEVVYADNEKVGETANESKEEIPATASVTPSNDNQSAAEGKQEKSEAQIAAYTASDKTEKNAVKPSEASSAAAVAVASPQAPAAAAEKTFPYVKRGFYFWMLLVYAIPVIGLIVNIITAASLKNPSKKNFAAAVLTWTLIGIGLGIILAIASVVIIAIAVTGSGGSFSGLSDILDTISQYTGGLITFN
ncbi:MAG: zinc ribbon domain-containing protein [Clostridia bacterium]|nr:zinc ribbon domain-containing protein [Clostridia bacterium]